MPKVTIKHLMDEGARPLLISKIKKSMFEEAIWGDEIELRDILDIGIGDFMWSLRCMDHDFVIELALTFAEILLPYMRIKAEDFFLAGAILAARDTIGKKGSRRREAQDACYGMVRSCYHKAEKSGVEYSAIYLLMTAINQEFIDDCIGYVMLSLCPKKASQEAFDFEYKTIAEFLVHRR